jgi:hypothetical protein
MSVKRADDARSAALDAYLDDRRAEGFAVETRTGVQAVIVRGNRLGSVTRWLGRGRPCRLVVSVDQDCTVTSIEAEPRRW